ncbi:MAG: hypothetical protein IJN48_02650, partial [Clostridia bacterium]|nr:hypothetical protein [Clostridia bacterium]
MKKKLALILVCVAAVIAIIAVAWIMREKEQPIVPLFPETVDTVPSGFSHIDSVLEEFDSSYVFWETQISIFDKTGVCIYQTDASDSSFIVECNGEYYINASVIEDAMHVNVTEPVVTTAPAEPTETAETTSAEIISTEVTTEEIKITAEPAVLE